MSTNDKLAEYISPVKKWILLFLALNNETPVIGKTMIVKQMFLLVKEILQDPKLTAMFDFYPYQLGPYSTALAREINKLLENGFLSAEKQGRVWAFRLSDTGSSAAAELIKSADETVLRRASSMKQHTNEWGLQRVLHYVYNRHPEYTTDSLIAET